MIPTLVYSTMYSILVKLFSCSEQMHLKKHTTVKSINIKNNQDINNYD